MAKDKKKARWSERMKFSAEESLKRMKAFPSRMDAMIAAVRKDAKKGKS
jgi:uncharacterized protein (DUF885 family)